VRLTASAAYVRADLGVKCVRRKYVKSLLKQLARFQPGRNSAPWGETLGLPAKTPARGQGAGRVICDKVIFRKESTGAAVMPLVPDGQDLRETGAMA
jgi:hypothetical protein